jgi:hypothetical protein
MFQSYPLSLPAQEAKDGIILSLGYHTTSFWVVNCKNIFYWYDVNYVIKSKHNQTQNDTEFTLIYQSGGKSKFIHSRVYLKPRKGSFVFNKRPLGFLNVEKTGFAYCGGS